MISKLGKVKFPSLKLKKDGKILQTKPFSITVTDGIQKRPTTSQQGTVRDSPMLFIERDLKAKPYFVGEVIEATVRIYYRQGIAEIGQPSNPGVDFANLVLHEQNFRDKEVVSGVEYNVVEFRQFIETKKVGNFVLPSLNAAYIVPSRGRSHPFFRSRGTRKSAKSNTNQIQIIDLPAGATTNFIGAVGDFRVTSNISDEEINTGETTTLTITIEGAGDLRGVVLKEPVVKNLKVYPDKPHESYKIDFDDGAVSRVDFKFALVPSKEGTFELPPITLQTFQPSTKKFVDLTTSSLRIVAKGAAGRLDSSDYGSAKKNAQKNIVTEDADLIDIIRDVSTSEGSGSPYYFKHLSNILFLLSFLIVLLSIVNRYASFKNILFMLKSTGIRSSSKMLKEFRQIDEESSSEKDKILGYYSSFKVYVAGLFDLHSGAISEKDILKCFEKLDLKKELVDDFHQITKSVLALEYGGVSDSLGAEVVREKLLGMSAAFSDKGAKGV